MTNKIKIDDELYINKGNFALVLDKFESDDIGKEIIYHCCLDAESKMKTDYKDSLSKFRVLFETLGIELEVKNIVSTKQLGFSDAREYVKNELDAHKHDKKDKYAYTSKNLLIWGIQRLLNDDQKKSRLEKLLERCYRTNLVKKYKNNDKATDIAKFLLDIYAISSRPHHPGYEGKKEDTEKVARYMYEILAIVCGHDGKLDLNACPYDDYFPVPALFLPQIGISNEALKLFVREQPAINFYVFKPAGDMIGKQKKRDLEILDSLWNQSLNTPNNIVYMRNEIGIKEYQMQVMALPAKPETLDQAVVHLSSIEKREVIKSITEAVRSMHHMMPRVTHRALCPLDFFVCKTANGIRTILYQFDYAKQWNEEDGYTVANRLTRINDTNVRSKFIDTQLLLKGIDEENAARADIYSLGELIKYILGDEIDEHTLQYVDLMTKPDFTMRPSVDDVFNFLYGKGSKLVSYSIISRCNPSKKKTQDAFICSGCDEIYGKAFTYNDVVTVPCFAGAFDGLGGAYYGDCLSKYIAEKTRDLLIQRTYKNNEVRFLSEFVNEAQKLALGYMETEELDYAGTTMALAIIDVNKVFIANVGDSRGYIIDNDGISQITKDHRYSRSVYKKGELYQYIGMDESDGSIQPFVEQYDYKDDGYLLLCTDGLTDYVEDIQIRDIVLKNATLNEKTKLLADKALENGLKDDITIVLIKKGI